MNPLVWGWHLKADQLYPVMSTQPPAPAFLLSYIRCGCKADGCNSNRCSCKKNGLSCSLSCVNCNGSSCGNPQVADDSSDCEVDDLDNDGINDDQAFLSFLSLVWTFWLKSFVVDCLV